MTDKSKLDDLRAEAEAVRRYKRRIARRSPSSTVEIFVSGFRYGLEYARTGKVAADMPEGTCEVVKEPAEEKAEVCDEPPPGPRAA